MLKLKNREFLFLTLPFLPVLFLQTVGILTPQWISEETCESRGLFFQCCGINSTSCSFYFHDEYPSKECLCLQIFALVSLFSAFVIQFQTSNMCILKKNGYVGRVFSCGGRCGYKYGFCGTYTFIMILSISFIFAGCILIGSKDIHTYLDDPDIGLIPVYILPTLSYSFYICIIAGIYTTFYFVYSLVIIVMYYGVILPMTQND